MTKRVVDLKVLPGQPLDGSGRVCIHLFVQDKCGPFTEPCVMRPMVDDQGEPVDNQVDLGPARGRLACDPKRLVAPVVRKTRGVESVAITIRTGDPYAVTCPKCMASADYADAMTRIEQACQKYKQTENDEET